MNDVDVYCFQMLIYSFFKMTIYTMQSYPYFLHFLDDLPHHKHPLPIPLTNDLITKKKSSLYNIIHILIKFKFTICNLFLPSKHRSFCNVHSGIIICSFNLWFGLREHIKDVSLSVNSYRHSIMRSDKSICPAILNTKNVIIICA